MQSKKSFFNGTVFRNNVGRSWFIAFGAFVIMFLVMGMDFVIGNVLHGRADMYEYDIFEQISQTAVMSWIFAAIIPPLMCLLMFSYLQKSTSVSFYHSLPVSREGLYITNILSGLFVMYIPNFIMYGFFLIETDKLGFCEASLLTKWLLLICAEEFFYYSVAIIGMILAGNTFVGVGIYILTIFLPGYVFNILDNIIKPITFGYAEWNSEITLRKYSPEYVFDNVQFNAWCRQSASSSSEMSLCGCDVLNFASTLIVTIVIALLILAVSLKIYKKRSSEASGDFIAVRWFKPIALWCIVFSFSTLVTSLLCDGFSEKVIEEYSFAMKLFTVLCFVVFGFIGYILAVLITEKNVSAIKKKLSSCLIFTAFMAVFGIGVLVFSSYLENYQPDTEDIAGIEIVYEGNDITVRDPEMIAELMKIHDKASAGRDKWLELHNDGGLDCFSIIYRLKSDEEAEGVRRWYGLPKEYKAGEDIEAFFQNNIIKLLYGNCDYNRVIICPYTDIDTEFGMGVQIENSESVARRVYEAVNEDVEAGRIDFSMALKGVNPSGADDMILYAWLFKVDYSTEMQEITNNGKIYITDKCTATMKVFRELIDEYGLR